MAIVQDPPSTQEGPGSLPSDLTTLDHQALVLDPLPTIDTIFPGVLHQEGESSA